MACGLGVWGVVGGLGANGLQQSCHQFSDLHYTMMIAVVVVGD